MHNDAGERVRQDMEREPGGAQPHRLPDRVRNGHTGCGAVRGACDNVKLGHITTLLEHIHPAVEEESTIKENRNGSNPGFVNAVARINVRNTVQEMIRESSIIRDMAAKGEIGIVPAMYDVATGLVTFFEDEALLKEATANHDAAKDVLPK